ncbi:hypothetical protein GMRT_10606 [Giardia muris]|uniref:Uncharacterized protein n=1 Tax=Giardia muris TaxID=5742 RepID=A0A4Z1SPM1_GIAMU|nr:hypothetical protein GMRT_10606 [Giardia muris]|eukprot:TNJ26815.1 hypothetical protein GMRT_10606 [Giardia muris]
MNQTFRTDASNQAVTLTAAQPTVSSVFTDVPTGPPPRSAQANPTPSRPEACGASEASVSMGSKHSTEDVEMQASRTLGQTRTTASWVLQSKDLDGTSEKHVHFRDGLEQPANRKEDQVSAELKAPETTGIPSGLEARTQVYEELFRKDEEMLERLAQTLPIAQEMTDEQYRDKVFASFREGSLQLAERLRERLGVVLLSTDVSKQIYQPEAIVMAEEQASPSSLEIIDPKVLQQIRRTIKRDTHALNRMLGNQAKKRIKTRLFGSATPIYPLTRLLTRNVITSGHRPIPTTILTDANFNHLKLGYVYAPEPCQPLDAELDILVQLSLDDYQSASLICGETENELRYILNVVAPNNLSETLGKVREQLLRVLCPEVTQHPLVIFLLVFDEIVKKAAMEPLFSKVYASLALLLSVDLPLHEAMLQYPTYQAFFLKRVAENERKADTDQFKAHTFNAYLMPIMERALESSLYDASLDTAFFKNVERQLATGTTEQKEQEAIAAYLSELKRLYRIGAAEFAGYLSISANALERLTYTRLVNEDALVRIYSNLCLFSTARTHLGRHEMPTKTTCGEPFDPNYLPCVNAHYIDALLKKGTVAIHAQTSQATFGHDHDYSFLEAALALLNIVIPHYQYYPTIYCLKRLVGILRSVLKVEKDKDKDKAKRLEKLLADPTFLKLRSEKVVNFVVDHLFNGTDVLVDFYPLLQCSNEARKWPELAKALLDRTAMLDSTTLSGLSEGELAIALAEKLEIFEGLTRSARLFQRLRDIYDLYIGYLKADETLSSHFHFLLVTFEENCATRYVSSPLVTSSDLIAYLKGRVSRVREYRASLKSRGSSNEQGGEYVQGINLTIAPKMASINVPNEAQVEAIRQVALESNLQCALQDVLHLTIDETTGHFEQRCENWPLLLAVCLVGLLGKSPTQDTIVTSVVNGLPDVIEHIKIVKCDAFYLPLLDILLGKTCNVLEEHPDYTPAAHTLFVSLMRKNIFSFNAIINTFSSQSKAPSVRALGQQIIIKFVTPAGDDADDACDKLREALCAAVVEQQTRDLNKVLDDHLFNLTVDKLSIVMADVPPGRKCTLSDVYQTLKILDAVSGTLQRYLTVWLRDPSLYFDYGSNLLLRFKSALDSCSFLENAKDAQACISTFISIALTVLSDDDVVEGLELTARRCKGAELAVGALMSIVSIRWKELFYPDEGLIKLWSYLIDAHLCTREQVRKYIADLPRFSPLRKQLSECSNFHLWLQREE